MVDLKFALIVSVLLHAGLLGVKSSDARIVPVKQPTEVVVDYVIMEDTPKPVKAEVEPPPIIVAAPKVELKRSLPKPPMPVEARDTEKKEEISDDAIKQRVEKRIRSTAEYINYYQLIRDKIRSKLLRNYKSNTPEGDVKLIFVLNSEGVLESAQHEKTDNEELGRLALRSLKQAAPFRPFPKELTLPRMTFTVTISFQRE